MHSINLQKGELIKKRDKALEDNNFRISPRDIKNKSKSWIIYWDAFYPVKDRYDFFNWLRERKDLYFMIISDELFNKFFDVTCYREVKEWYKVVSENIDFDILDNVWNPLDMSAFIRHWRNPEAFEEKSFLDPKFVSQLKEILKKMEKRLSKACERIVPRHTRKNPIYAFELTNAEIRLLRLLVIKRTDYFEQLSETEVKNFLRRSKDFIAENYRIDRVEAASYFINRSWAENGCKYPLELKN